MERQPNLSLRKGDATASVRMDAMNDVEALDSYFKLLKDVMEEHGLMDQPGQIYEPGMPLEHRPPKSGYSHRMCQCCWTNNTTFCDI